MSDRFGSPFASGDIRLQTVTELTSSIKGLLETSFAFVTVTGQISNLRRAPSGHLYFSLKDQQAQIKAVLFRQQQRYLSEAPTDGQEVVCRGRVSVYEPRGEYQLIIDFMDTRGLGELHLAFELLKKRLEQEGLFAEAAKQPVPFLPRRIALITSPSGAAVFDFLRIAASRFPSIPIEIYPVRVQGEGAAKEIIQALELANQRDNSQVIVLCRGGGSLEDLWPFNEEQVARAIYGSKIPVVSAVGHEVDFTIADFVADLRAPTPSAAAQAVLPDRQKLIIKTKELERRLLCALQRKIELKRYRAETHRRLLGDPSFLLAHFLLLLDHKQTAMLNAFTDRLRDKQGKIEHLRQQLLKHSPVYQIRQQKHSTEELGSRLLSVMKRNLERKRLRFGQAAALLDAVSPLAILGRGYAIARTLPDHKVVRESTQVQKGVDIEVLLHRGLLRCRVMGAEPQEADESGQDASGGSGSGSKYKKPIDYK